MNVEQLIAPLRGHPREHSFGVVPVPQWSGTLVGFDSRGHPCLFFEADDTLFEPPLRTKNLSLWPSRNFRLSYPGGMSKSGKYHLLLCESSLPSDHMAFLAIAGGFLSQSKSRGAIGPEVLSFFKSASHLFAAPVATDLSQERQGLWGELFVMSHVKGFRFWAPYWHAEVGRLFDFSAPGERHLEVKTTRNDVRVHRFSHRQVFAMKGEAIAIASLMLRPQPDGGLTLRELIESCRESLGETPYYLKVEAVIRHTEMEESSVLGPAFDAEEARKSLSWYWAKEVPQFRSPEPPGVSEAHYKVDLTGVGTIPRPELMSWIDAWNA